MGRKCGTLSIYVPNIYCIDITLLHFLALCLNSALQFSFYSALRWYFRPSGFLFFWPSGFGLRLGLKSRLTNRIQDLLLEKVGEPLLKPESNSGSCPKNCPLPITIFVPLMWNVLSFFESQISNTTVTSTQGYTGISVTKFNLIKALW